MTLAKRCFYSNMWQIETQKTIKLSAGNFLATWNFRRAS